MREENRSFFAPQDTADSGRLLLSTIEATRYKKGSGLDLIRKQGCQHPVPAWPPSSSQATCVSLLLSDKSLMEDLKLLNSEWDTINALVFLINDVGYRNRDKLTLLAAARCLRVNVRVWKKWTETDTSREGDRFRLQAALKSVYSLRWALWGQPYSSRSLPLHYSGSGHTLFSSLSLRPQGPIQPLTNTLTQLFRWSSISSYCFICPLWLWLHIHSFIPLFSILLFIVIIIFLVYNSSQMV